MASYLYPSFPLEEHGEQEQSLMVKLVQVAVEAEVRQVERMARQVELIAGKVGTSGTRRATAERRSTSQLLSNNIDKIR